MLIPSRRVTDVDKKTAVIANAVGTGAYYMGIGGVIIPGATSHVFAGTSPNITPFITGATSSATLILGVITGILCNGKFSEQTNILGVNAAQTGKTSAGPGTDNETYKTWSVEYIPAYIPMEYVADFSAALGTTTDSGANAYFAMTGIDTTSGDDGVVLESSGVIYSATRTSKPIFLSGPASSSKKGYVHFQSGLTI